MNETLSSDRHQQGGALVVSSAAPTGALSVFGSVDNFATAQRMAKALASSTLVPSAYQGEAGMGNCLIAMEVASRTGASVLAVMQSLNVIEGRPGWSSQYVIAAINTCGRFAPLRFDMQDAGEKTVQYEYWSGPRGQREKKTGQQKLQDKQCIAWTVERGILLPPNVRTLDQAREANVPVIEGPPVTFEIAVREGWWHRSGSKWQTMPDLMLTYRAAAFFGRIHAPDVLMGMHTADEVEDIIDVTPRPVNDNVPPAATPKPAAPAAATIDGEATPAASEPRAPHPAAAAAKRAKKQAAEPAPSAPAPAAAAAEKQPQADAQPPAQQEGGQESGEFF